MNVIDSCVFVSAFCEADPKHVEAQQLLKKIIDGEIKATLPTLALPEVCGVIRRLTGSSNFASKVREEMERWISDGLLKVEELTKARMRESSKIAIQLGVKGADAVFISLAQELNAKLITFDEEIKRKLEKSKYCFENF
jgi:predicted nucleic acid-binding protein